MSPQPPATSRTGRPPRGARQVRALPADLPPAAARLYRGYEAADTQGKGLIFEWPADHPYGDVPRYDGAEESLFSAEERELPLDQLRQRASEDQAEAVEQGGGGGDSDA